MENRSFEESKASEYYTRFICVVVQYVSELNNEKMIKLLKARQNENCEQKVSRKGFHFRLAQKELSHQLTGYRFNSVTPFLLAEKWA